MQLVYNNQNFDTLISGYTTANVEGRGLSDRDLTTVNISGRDGVKVITQKIPARTLIVYYVMKAANSVTFLYQLNQLHNLLKTDVDRKIQFSDEDYYRMGRLNKKSDPPFDSLQGLGSFELFCQDPYKYKDIANLAGTALTVPGTSLYPYLIKSITITFTAARTGLTIINNTTGKRIVLTGSFAAGQVLQILPEDGKILLNGASAMNRLDYINSDWREFQFWSGNSINTGVNATVALAERAL